MSDTLTKVQITNSGYLKECRECKGCVTSMEDLPTENLEVGDIYEVDGVFYTWDGSDWCDCGAEVNLGGGKSYVSIKSAEGENIIITDAMDGPMLLNDWDKTLFEREEYKDGYNIHSYSDNLSVNPINGTTGTQYHSALSDNNIFLPDRTYEISFIGALGHKVYPNENLFLNGLNFDCTGEKQTFIYKTKSSITNATIVTIFKNFTGNTIVPNFTDVKIRLVSQVTVTENSKAPILLESYKDYTEIVAPSDVSIGYATDDIGRSILLYTDPTILKADQILNTVTKCESSVNKTDIVGASVIAELKKNTVWKLIANGTGSETISLNLSDYEEILVLVHYSGGVKFTQLIPVLIIDDNEITFNIGGYYAIAQSNGSINVYLSKTTARLGTAYLNGSSAPDKCDLYIYAR